MKFIVTCELAQAGRAIIIISLLASVCSGGPLPQQSITSATLSGVVEDPTGAAITDAKVTITNLHDNQSSAVTTDEQGRFRFPYLRVGTYRLRIERNGFATVERELTLSLGETVDLAVHMSVTAVSATANITSQPTLVETVRTQVAESVSPRDIAS